MITVDEAWELVETHEKTGKWATLGLEGFGDLTLMNKGKWQSAKPFDIEPIPAL